MHKENINIAPDFQPLHLHKMEDKICWVEDTLMN